MPVDIQREIRRELHRRYEMPPRIAFLYNTLFYDLYHGPVPEGEDFDGRPYPGFTSGLDELSNWFNRNVPSEIWYDSDSGEVFEREPEGYEDEGEWIEPFWESIYHVDDTRRAMFGKLAEYM